MTLKQQLEKKIRDLLSGIDLIRDSEAKAKYDKAVVVFEDNREFVVDEHEFIIRNVFIGASRGGRRYVYLIVSNENKSIKSEIRIDASRKSVNIFYFDEEAQEEKWI